MDWRVLFDDFLIALIGFYFVRYIIPNSILKKDISHISGFVYSMCYALFGLIRNLMNLSRHKELEYYHI